MKKTKLTLCFIFTLFSVFVFANGNLNYKNALKAYSEENFKLALTYLDRSIEEGNKDALLAAATIYIENLHDNESAIPYLRLSSQKNNAMAQYSLAKILLNDPITDNVSEAKELLISAVKSKNGDAAYLLFELETDNNVKASLIIFAAEQGVKEAIEVLAIAYATGAYGIPVDQAKESFWLEQLSFIEE